MNDSMFSAWHRAVTIMLGNVYPLRDKKQSSAAWVHYWVLMESQMVQEEGENDHDF